MTRTKKSKPGNEKHRAKADQKNDNEDAAPIHVKTEPSFGDVRPAAAPMDIDDEEPVASSSRPRRNQTQQQTTVIDEDEEQDEEHDDMLVSDVSADLLGGDISDNLCEDDEMLLDYNNDTEAEAQTRSRAPEADQEEDDPVVAEIDVFLSTALADALFLLQFPTRPVPFTPDALPKTGRIKSKTKRLQLDIALEPSGEHYDRNQGERFGQGLDNKPLMTAYDYLGNNGAGANANSSQWLESVKLESKTVPIHAQYMVGYLIRDDDNASQSGDSGLSLHLKPVSTILQLRPVLDYIDRISEKEKSASQKIMYEERKEADGAEEEAKVIQVMVRGADDKDAARKATIAELQRMTENEAWTELKVYGPEHEDSAYFRNMIINSGSDSVDLAALPAEYLDKISPFAHGDIDADASTPTGPATLAGRPDPRKNVARAGLSLVQIRRLPLAERLKALFVNAHVIHFSTIKELVAENVPDDELIRAITEVSVLIRGIWVVRSEFLYSGRPFDARRYLLMLFHDHEYVSRKEFVDVTRLPLNMAAGMLNEIADLDPNRGWRLKLLPDNEFVKKHRDLVTEQSTIISTEGTRAYDAMRPPERTRSRRYSQQNMPPPISATSSSSSGPATSHPSVTSTTSAHSASPTVSLSALSNGPRVLAEVKLEPGLDTEGQTRGLIKQLFDHDSVCSRDYVVNSILVHRDRKHNISQDISPEIIEKILSDMCQPVRPNIFVLKPSGDNISTKAFRAAIIDCFSKLDFVKKVDVTAAYNSIAADMVASTMSPGKQGKGSRSIKQKTKPTEVPPMPAGTSYTKMMQDIATAEKGTGIWILKASPPAPLLE